MGICRILAARLASWYIMVYLRIPTFNGDINTVCALIYLRLPRSYVPTVNVKMKPSSLKTLVPSVFIYIDIGTSSDIIYDTITI